ncbi:MAG TPA: hypothetical protein VMW36_03875 [Patescibacteria group bacterium]|nr:hypothetical protein [Patescibacteria group bacterium]
MSVLARFEVGPVKYKATIYEHGNARLTCPCCKSLKYGALVRTKEPLRIKESIVCPECLAKIALGILKVSETDPEKPCPVCEAKKEAFRLKQNAAKAKSRAKAKKKKKHALSKVKK